jgi:hypothetical protein
LHTLSQHYREKKMCEGARKTFATNRTNEGYLDRWILPRWSSRVKSGLLGLFGPAENLRISAKSFILLASPTGFEPVLSP